MGAVMKAIYSRESVESAPERAIMNVCNTVGLQGKESIKIRRRFPETFCNLRVPQLRLGDVIPAMTHGGGVVLHCVVHHDIMGVRNASGVLVVHYRALARCMANIEERARILSKPLSIAVDREALASYGDWDRIASVLQAFPRVHPVVYLK